MEKSDTLITMHKIPIFSFTCLIGYFYKQDAGWKMIQLGCNEISLLHSYFTPPHRASASMRWAARDCHGEDSLVCGSE